MPILFLVDGASGSGKTDFIQHFCNEASQEDAYIKKYTTKTLDDDGVKRPDLIYCTKEEYQAYKIGLKKQEYFEYSYPEDDSGCHYMALKKDIDEKLYEYNNVYLIVRNSETIKAIKKEYGAYLNVKVVSIFIYSDSVRLKERAAAQCFEKNITDRAQIEKYVNKRLQRNAECLKSYISTIGDQLYDYIILNDIGYDEYHKCMKNIKRKFEDDIIRFSELNAFIIMPMTAGREWVHFNEVKKAIIKGAKMQGFIAERQDDKNNPRILESIKESIDHSLVCIVDLTLSRPNCYYELGIADETHRTEQILILKQEKEELAFDLQGRKCSDYTFHESDYSRISNIVSQKLAAFVKNSIFMTKELEAYIKFIQESE